MIKKIDYELLFIIVVAIVFGLICGGLGYFLASGKTTIVGGETNNQTLSMLGSSKLVPMVSAFGVVTKISGRDVVLSDSDGKNLTIATGQEYTSIFKYTLVNLSIFKNVS